MNKCSIAKQGPCGFFCIKYWLDGGCDENCTSDDGRCSCGRFLKTGQLFENLAGEIKLKGWICSRCGEVQPYFDREC